MLIRIDDRSGGGAGCGSSTGGGSGAGSGGAGGVSLTTGAGVVVQAASCSASSAIAKRQELVTEPDTHDIDLGRPEPAARHIEFVKIVNGADVDPVVIAIIDPCALHTRSASLCVEKEPACNI